MKKKNSFRSLVLFSGLTAASIAGINQYIFISAVSKNALSTDHDLYYNWKLGKIYFTKEGTGSPLLLIHELDSMSCDFEWKKIKKKLSKNHTIYTIDLLGCGRSEKPHFTYTNFLYVQLITDFIKHIIGSPCDVISSGQTSSLVAMSALYQKELFHSIIFINPEELSETYKLPEKQEKILRGFLQLPILGTLFYNIVHSRFMIKRKLKYSLFYQPAHVQDVDIQAFHEASHLGNYSVKYLYGSLKTSYTQIPVVAALQKLACPVLILGGTGETKIEQTIADYKNLNHMIKSRLIPDTIHYPHMEAPEKTAETIESFYFAKHFASN